LGSTCNSLPKNFDCSSELRRGKFGYGVVWIKP
jgi:hypothetical protein